MRESRLGRARFEAELRPLVNARSIAVRDCAPDSARRPDVISFDVPSASWTTPARLGAVFEATRAVTESQLRTRSFGAQIASLLVQIECASGGGSRLRRRWRGAVDRIQRRDPRRARAYRAGRAD